MVGDQKQITPTSSPNSGTVTGRSRHRNRQLLAALAMSRSNPRWLDFEMPLYRTGDHQDQSSSSSSLSLSSIPVHEGSMSEIVQRALDIVSQAETDRGSDLGTCSSRFTPSDSDMQHDEQNEDQEGRDISSDHHGVDSTEQHESGPNHNDQEQS